jgi:hypothetical protein
MLKAVNATRRDLPMPNRHPYMKAAEKQLFSCYRVTGSLAAGDSLLDSIGQNLCCILPDEMVTPLSGVRPISSPGS